MAGNQSQVKKRQQTISGTFGTPRRVVSAAKDLSSTSRSRTSARHTDAKQSSGKKEIDQYKYLSLLDQSDPTPPIHEVNMPVIDKVLRQFDLNREYGPAAGLTRLARWERANKLGKNPPSLLKDLLLEVSDSKKYSVFGTL